LRLPVPNLLLAASLLQLAAFDIVVHSGKENTSQNRRYVPEGTLMSEEFSGEIG
jgi:hypothetical protein